MAIRVPRIVKAVVREAGADQIGRLAAALAYFAVFAMPGLLVLAIGAASTVVGWEAVQSRVLSETEGFVGAEGAKTVREIIASASQPKGSTLFTKILGSLALVFGATGFFLQLQDALNAMWGAKGNERRAGIGAMIRKRILSLGMIMALALLLLVSLALSAVFSAMGDRLAGWLAGSVSAGVVAAIQLVVTFALTTVLFAAVYKVMPDLKIEWREVWIGAAATALLFTIGKLAIGFYLGRSDPGSAYGAAGPLVVILVWVYYSTLVVLVGAEFTQVYARLYGPHKAERSKRMASKAEHDPRVSAAKGPRPTRKAG